MRTHVPFVDSDLDQGIDVRSQLALVFVVKRLAHLLELVQGLAAVLTRLPRPLDHRSRLDVLDDGARFPFLEPAASMA